ncbi:hypothetical protein HP548_12475 [Paenibacillus taichungensis]|uniref:Uncharacterized protein n=1 Tax=Paenibacillus taichungensis TaxID=484184 RepID=A0ABX2MLG0_9BACL|nr:hypothetical protein [Paenibacillus taichungensis]NUU54892.1 hypothetical protein [Paenibacillus taichungensis]
MDEERLREIENNIINNPKVDLFVVQQVLLECVDEIRTLKNTDTGVPGRIFDPRQNIGKTIIITRNTNSHEFEIGQECVIVEWDNFSEEVDGHSGVEAMAVGDVECDTWYVLHSDYDFK